MKRLLLSFLIFFAALAGQADAQTRAVAFGQNFNSTITDLNTELDYLFDKGFVPLDSVSGTNDILASIEGLPGLTSYTNGLKVRLKPVNNNTGAVRLNIDSQGLINVRDAQGNVLSSGDLVANQLYWLEYSSSDNEFRVLSFLGGGGGSSGFAEYAVQVFTASGTWTKPADLLFAFVECVGGGAGGGGGGSAGGAGAGTGGGGGGYTAEQFATADLGATETVTIGAGGAAGSGTTNGTAGGNTTFGALMTAGGGVGGDDTSKGTTEGAVALTGPAGGTASGGDLNIPGERGGDASAFTGPAGVVELSFSGNGGDSQFGSGGPGRTDTGANSLGGLGGGNYGGGGGGGSRTSVSTTVAGGVGAGGLCVVHEYKS